MTGAVVNQQWGKMYRCCFSGSMAGQGPVKFATWSYAIAHQRGGQVDLNPLIVATAIGAPIAEVEEAITWLQSPDPQSRSKREGGARLKHVTGVVYQMVNYDLYNGTHSTPEQRESARNRQAKSRARRARETGHTAVTAVTAQSRVEEKRKEKEREEENRSKRGADAPTRTTSPESRERFIPDKKDLKLTKKLGLSGDELKREVEKFRDYEPRRPYKDLHKAFRNWLRKAIEFRAERVSKTSGGSARSRPTDGNSYSRTDDILPATREVASELQFSGTDRWLKNLQSAAQLKAKGKTVMLDSRSDRQFVKALAARLAA